MRIWQQLLAMACWAIPAQVVARTQRKSVLFIAVDDLDEDKGSSKAKGSSTHFACEHQVNLSFHLQENEVIKTIFTIMVLLTTSTAHAEPNVVFLFADNPDADKPIKLKKEIKTQ